MKDYQIIPWNDKEFAISFISGKYDSIIYVYKGSVSFDERVDDVVMKFDYEILDGKELIENISDFEKYIGNILTDMIEYSLAKNETVFTGGK